MESWLDEVALDSQATALSQWDHMRWLQTYLSAPVYTDRVMKPRRRAHAKGCDAGHIFKNQAFDGLEAGWHPDVRKFAMPPLLLMGAPPCLSELATHLPAWPLSFASLAALRT